MKDETWRIPDDLWRKMERFLPPRKPHPLGCHNPRVPDRDAMDAILLVLRTGCKWSVLDTVGLCSRSAAHRRFKEWDRAMVFERFRMHGLFECEPLRCVALSRLAQVQEPSVKSRKRPRTKRQRERL